MDPAIYRAIFHSLAFLGRPIGGIRPRRFTNIAADRGFLDRRHPSCAFRWRKDRWGSELLLSPYYVLDRGIIAYGASDLELGQCIKSFVRPGMVCFDIGANIGEAALHMGRRVGSEGHVYAFEPVPLVRQRLVRHVQRNGLEKIVSIEAVALSDKTGTTTISHADEDATNQGMGSLVIKEESLKYSLEVPTIRLDDFVAGANISRLDLMKVDIQGAEQMMLAGATETLNRFGPSILLEVSGPDLVAMGSSAGELLTKVEKLGYRIYAVERGKRGRQIHAAEVPADVYWNNVLCEKNGRS